MRSVLSALGVGGAAVGLVVNGAASVTEAGIDTWSPSWYVDPDGPAGLWLSEHAAVRSKRGSWLLPEPIAGHRVGWFPSGLVFAEGHPDPDGLCRPSELTARCVGLQDALLEAGVPLPVKARCMWHMSAAGSPGWAGLRRVDATVNVAMEDRASGLALLAGIAACVRDAPGKSNVRFGPDRGVETVYVHGRAGRAVLGRWYDKALEAAIAPRGTVIRGEDQRQWPKAHRRDPEDLDAEAVKGAFQRRFYPLWKASKGVTVASVSVLAVKVIELAASGEIEPQFARLACGDLLLESIGHEGALVKPSTRRRNRVIRRELGLVLADGVLEAVEIDVGAVLEDCLETDAWERRG